MERIRRQGRSALFTKGDDNSTTACSEANYPQQYYYFHLNEIGYSPVYCVETLSQSHIVSRYERKTVEVDVESRQLLSVNGEDVNGVEHHMVLDLNDEGERWEGDVLYSEPFGWGVLYDKEGEKAYEGFRIGNVAVCYGRSYYVDIGVIEYEGEICEGKRWGRGIQYDRNGVVLYDGEWLDNDHVEKRMVMNDETEFLHNHIEELIVSDDSCDGREWSVLDLTMMTKLRLLRIGDRCFEHVERVKLIGLHALESVVIGSNSFTSKRNAFGFNTNRRFYLKDCEKINELQIGSYSFSDYYLCKMENLSSIQKIEMGELNSSTYIFYNADFVMKSTEMELE